MDMYHDNTRKELVEVAEKYKDLSFSFLHHTGYMYGIGCKADDKNTIERIKQYKERPDNKGFIVLLPSVSALSLTDGEREVRIPGNNFKPIQLKIDLKSLFLLEQYQPGNLTLCLQVIDSKDYEHLMLNGKLAIRVPESQYLRYFIRLLNRPVVSTSVNRPGEEPLKNFKVIRKLDWFDFAILSSKDMKHRSAPSTIVESDNNNLTCHREGFIPFKEVEESYHKPLVLFVCTGNICRSPLAEYYARHIFKQRGLSFRTASAGFIPVTVAISSHSFSVLNNDGIHAGEHYSQHLHEDLIRKAWLILTMEKDHRNLILKAYPACKHKVFTLSGFCGSKGDVEDPFRQDMEKYVNTYQLIKKYIDILADKLILRSKKLVTLYELAKIKPEDVEI
ncbi:MAG: Sua5/YciO/YrdC/YwlC family protein [Candidatus Cloacimonetes bacterium]|nr:Sua5/YciO/YrdC/YwlC family protein [Candidatus Cloacimonadota bacterium]